MVQRDYCHAKLSNSAHGLLAEHPNATATDLLGLSLSCSHALISCHVQGVTVWARACNSCHIGEEGVDYSTWASTGPETCTAALDSCQSRLGDGMADVEKAQCLLGVAICTGYGFSTISSYQTVYDEGMAAFQRLYPQAAGRTFPLNIHSNVV